MKKVLVIRLSALGDIVMTLPVIHAVARQYPDHQFYYLSIPFVGPLINKSEPNIVFVSADFKSKHAGLKGLFQLFLQLRKLDIDIVVDLHGVLRTHFLRLLFRLSGTKTAMIFKDRKGKKNLTRRDNKVMKPLQSGFDRYLAVFEKSGMPAKLDNQWTFPGKSVETISGKTKIKIGIAPFAKHEGKIYPPTMMQELIRQLIGINATEVYLFGGGKKEIDILKQWSYLGENIHLMAGKYSLTEEIEIMHQLDLMITMDSANMHLASISGTRVLSIWGATHPNAGFKAWNSRDEDIIHSGISCSPCSVFGNKACFRGDFACMHQIEPGFIVEKIKSALKIEA